jgi:hypothetical protein
VGSIHSFNLPDGEAKSVNKLYFSSRIYIVNSQVIVVCQLLVNLRYFVKAVSPL